MRKDRSRELLHRAQAVIPGGVNSPVRAFKSVGGDPLFIARAKGANVWDADGNGYIDYVGSWGPMILGHADPSVVEAVKNAVDRGSSFGAPTEGEIRLAEAIVKRVPSVEKVRLVSSGTEATMSALRLARGFTGRDDIVKFEGCYHGHADHLLVKAGSGVATFDLPDSKGVPADFAKHTISLPYNDIAAVRDLFAQRGAKIAAIIVEPVAGNMGLVPPVNGFLEALRDIATQYGALLVFDEVMTGFRVHAAGAQGLFAITPDLTAFGKIVGGGLPLGAFGGRADVMDMLAPDGPVYQAGTLSGNPCAVAAGLKTLENLSAPGLYDQLEKISRRIGEGLTAILKETGISGRVQRVGSMFTLYFGEGTPLKNFTDVKAADHARFSAYFAEMLARGIYLPPSGYEANFVSLAHTSDDVDRTLDSARAAISSLSDA
ncbi:MAG: glutamate-1-semialdehyde 2,1-aminomutase [Deltaproteobacteria bacterium]|nr:glutamate-1-semialdehyde 2,1-aminomutase [Deltaproteobacteria bacterium]